MTYVIGVDGGGTKTTCLFNKNERAFTVDAKSNLTVIGDSTNHQTVGFEETACRLETLFQKGLREYAIPPEEIQAVCIGLAGMRSEKDQLRMKHQLKKIGSRLNFAVDARYFVTTDVHIALRGSLKPDDQSGILVISGTGSNAIGMSEQAQLHTTGGWGHLLGDEGSGYQIGLKALNCITRKFDLRGPKTQLTKMILEELQLQGEEELIPFIYGSQPDKKEIARFAAFVIQAAEQGDEVSVQILQDAAEELVIHVESLFRQCSDFSEMTPVMTSGSIFKHSELLKSNFIENLKARKLGSYQESYGSPFHGAAMIAREL